MIRYLFTLGAAAALSGCYLMPYEMTPAQASTLGDSQLIAACAPKDPVKGRKTPEMREPAIAEAVRRGLIRKSMADDVRNRYAVVGMSENEARAAWGPPRDINRTRSAYFNQDQWCYGEYGGSYLYFSGGRLRTIQN